MKTKNPETDSSDDEEDDEQMKMFREAADPMLLTNDMFQTKDNQLADPKKNDETLEKTKSLNKESISMSFSTIEPLKSERYLPEDEYDNGTDLQLPVTVQEHLYKKLSEILNKSIKFCDFKSDETMIKKEKKIKSKVKLLRDFDCYIDCQLEEELVKGPSKKPEIKKRKIKAEEPFENGDLNETNMLESVVVTGSDILAGVETKNWAKKTEKKEKLFEYKEDRKGICHAIPRENEFTAARKKNQWNETKIKLQKQK